MTTQEKNVEIAKMLGWEYKLIGFHKKWIPKESDWFSDEEHYSDYELMFHSDANWQFEVINWIDKNDDYRVSIEGNNCWIIKMDYGSEIISVHKQNFEGTKKEAIFEALFQFSQYLKSNEKNISNTTDIQ